MDFTKPARTWEQQLTLLQDRGLIIPDADRTRHYLAHINYYRLTGYWLPFEEDHASHKFRPGVSFDDVLNLYIFDREFRLLLLDAIERVEVSLRAQWAYHMAHEHGDSGPSFVRCFAESMRADLLVGVADGAKGGANTVLGQWAA